MAVERKTTGGKPAPPTPDQKDDGYGGMAPGSSNARAVRNEEKPADPAAEPEVDETEEDELEDDETVDDTDDTDTDDDDEAPPTPKPASAAARARGTMKRTRR
jgi:hypothetical protein